MIAVQSACIFINSCCIKICDANIISSYFLQVQHKVPLHLHCGRHFAPGQAKLSRRNHKLVHLLGVGRGALVDLLDPVHDVDAHVLVVLLATSSGSPRNRGSPPTSHVQHRLERDDHGQMLPLVPDQHGVADDLDERGHVFPAPRHQDLLGPALDEQKPIRLQHSQIQEIRLELLPIASL